jgi:DNA-binding beta-propeller fold protein YncE
MGRAIIIEIRAYFEMKGVNLGNFKLFTLVFISLTSVPYASSQCLPTGLHARYTYDSWDRTTSNWRNSAGPGTNAAGSGSGFSSACRSNQNGASGRVCEVSGSTASVLDFGVMPTSYTMCSVARYAGNSRQRIFTANYCRSSRNWLHGFHNSQRGVAYDANWMTSGTSLVSGTDWLVFCGQNQAPNAYFANGMSVGAGAGGQQGGFYFGVNNYCGGSCCGESGVELSDFAIMEVSIWFRPLTVEEIRTVSSIYRAILSGSLNQTFPSTCRPKTLQPLNLARSCGPDFSQDCTATQSSVALWLGMDADVAVDGSKTEETVASTDLFYGTHTNTDNYPWIRIDMATSRSIGSGQIWNRPDSNAPRLDGFQVWVGDSPSYNGPNNINCYTATTTPHNAFPYLHYFPCVGTGRYLFVCIPRSGTWLHVREIEVYPPCSNSQSAVEPQVFVAHNYHSIRKLAVVTGAVTTVAGNAYGNSGYSDGVGTSARFQNPRGVAVSPDGLFILVADYANRLIRKVDLFTAAVSYVAGSTSSSRVSDGPGIYATFHSPFGIALSPDGAIALITEIGANVVRKIALLTSQVTTIAGLAGSSGSADGVGTNSRFDSPSFVAISPDGVYALIPEWNNHVIRRVEISTGAVTTLVGSKGVSGSADGFGDAARFNKPVGIAVSPDGFYALVTDNNNFVVRKIVISIKSVTTLSGAMNARGYADGRGTASRFNYGNQVAISPDGWYAIVTDANGQTIRFVTIDTGDVNTLAGVAGVNGMADGVGLGAQFYNPEGAAVKAASCSTGLFQVPCGSCPSGSYRAGCTWNSPGICSTCDTCPAGQYRSGCGGTSPGTCLCSASSGTYPVVLRNGPSQSCLCGRVEVLYNGVWGTVCDDYFDATDASVVCKQLQLASGNIIATESNQYGTGSIWMDNVGCVGTETALSSCPFQGWGSHDCSHSEDVSVCCCLVCPRGQYSTGCSGTSPGSCLACPACPDGKFRVGCADSSPGYCTSCLASFALVADSDNHIVRRIQWDSRAVTTLAGTKQVSGTADGVGTSAYFNTPHSIVMSPAGDVAYVLDTWNHAIRSIVISTGYVDTLAGNKALSGSSDGAGTSAQFYAPVGLGILPDGTSLLVADSYNHAIRVISSTTRSVSTLAGVKGVSGSADGNGASARFNSPRGITVSPDGLFAFVSDTGNAAIRRVILSSGAVTTLAILSGPVYPHLVGLAVMNTPASLTLLVADYDNHAIRQISLGTGVVTTLAGSLGLQGSSDEIGTNARFMNPYSVSISTDGLIALVPEYGNNAIRQIELDTISVTTIAGQAGSSGSQDGAGRNARFYHIRGVSLPSRPPTCVAGQYLDGCQGTSPGACAWCSSCPAEKYRAGCAGLSAGICQNCSACAVGKYNYGCSGLLPGSCTDCTSCPSGQYMRGCGGSSGGACDVCSSCGVGQYRSGCSGLSPGSCLPCVTCSPGQYLSGCGPFSPGICVACPTCQDGQYMSGCTGTSSGTCIACDTTCPPNSYRQNCGGTFDGTCTACEACPGDQVRSGCTGTRPGTCTNSACKTCQADQFLDGCSGLLSGTCRNCSACPVNQFRKDCGGNSSGACIPCDSVPCPTGQYRVNCTYTSQGTCRTCDTCPSDHYRINCSGISGGVCVVCNACPWGQYRRGCIGTAGGTCVACDPCPAGSFRVQCAGPAVGRCEDCNCSDGYFRSNCSGLAGGTCIGCEGCPEGQYRSACSGNHPGMCVACESCTSGKFRGRCGGLFGGTCLDCTQCPANTFCLAGRDSCVACAECPAGKYRLGCGGLSAGSCEACEACAAGSFRVNCSGWSSGYCVSCNSAPCESDDQYRIGCGGLSVGYCTMCSSCPSDMYRTGCNGTSAGSCTPCLPCLAGMQRKGCSGTRAGSCKDCFTQNTYALVVDASAHVLLRINIPSRKLETIAGLAGSPGSVDGTGNSARFSSPVVAAYIPAGKVTTALLTDRQNHVVRSIEIESGSVKTLAGTKGVTGTLDGSGTNARFHQPFGLAVSSTGETAYVSESAGHTIRSIQIKTGVVATGAGGRGVSGALDSVGTEARFFNPCGLALALDDRYLFVADSSNHLIRRVDVNTWETITIAGSNGSRGSADGVGTVATFSSPQDVAVSPDGMFLFVADRDSNKLRRIHVQSRLTASFKSATSILKPSFISLSADGLFAFICEDASDHFIKKVAIDSGDVTILARGASPGNADLNPQSFSGLTLLPQVPRRIVQIVGEALDYVRSLKLEFSGGSGLEYTFVPSNSNLVTAIQTKFSFQDGECIKMVQQTIASANVQAIAFSTSFGRSFSIQGSAGADNGVISIWRSGIRECILELELDDSAEYSSITDVVKACIVCVPGTFVSATLNQTGEVEDVCLLCPAGKFSNTSRARDCSPCETGTYSQAGGTACLKCGIKPPGIFSSSGSGGSNGTCIYIETSRYVDSAQSCSWECVDGYFRNGEYCLQCRDSSNTCADSEYLTLCSKLENARCKACSNKPPNSFYTKRGYITSNCSWTCDVQYFMANSSCSMCNTTPCPPDTHAIPCTENSDRICAPCSNFKPPNSLYTGVAKNSPASCMWQCSRGFFCSNISKFASCYDANSSCSQCSKPNCSGLIVACTEVSDAFCANSLCYGLGKFYYMTPKNLPLGSPGGNCMPCTPIESANRCQIGYYRSFCKEFSDTECLECINGPKNCGNPESGCSYNSDGNLNNNFTCGWHCRPGMQILGGSCTNCPYGKYESSGLCFNCGGGQYSSSEASQSCQLCEKGKYSTVVGASSVLECKSCRAGKFQDVLGATVCKDCQANSYSEDIGAISDTACKACPQSPVPTTTFGKTGQMYLHNCLCPKRFLGNLSDYYRFKENSTDCLACPRGLSCGGEKVVTPLVKDSTWVLNSSFGYVLESCPAGYSYKRDPNFFSYFLLLQEFQECLPCSKGFDCSHPPCETCNMCSLGKYKGCDGIENCQECPLDTYADSNASLECIRCPISMSTRGLKQRTSINDCICSENSYAMGDELACQICPPGLKCYGNLRDPEPKPLMVASVLDGYTLDSSLFVGVSKWTKQKQYWKLAYCPPGFRMSTVPEVDYKDQQCIACGRGEDCHPDRAPCQKCSACPKGKYKSDRFFYQANLPRTYFSTQDSAYVREWVVEPCENCPADTYRNREGGTERGSCTPCPARSTTLGISGKSSIFDCVCDSQFYLVNLSSSDFECQVCPRGAVCLGRSRACALQTSPPSCPCEEEGDFNSSNCQGRVPGSWAVEQVSGRRGSSVKKTVFRLNSCPPGYMLYKDPMYPDLDECQKCISGKYSLLSTKISVTSGNASCRLCPFGAECPGGDVVTAKSGFWRDFRLVNSTFAAIYVCPPGACESDNRCTKNRTGEICGYCPEGYALTTSGCTECPEPGKLNTYRIVSGILVSTVIIVAWTCLAWYKILVKEDDGKKKSKGPFSVIVYPLSKDIITECICAWSLTHPYKVLNEYFNIADSSSKIKLSYIHKPKGENSDAAGGNQKKTLPIHKHNLLLPVEAPNFKVEGFWIESVIDPVHAPLAGQETPFTSGQFIVLPCTLRDKEPEDHPLQEEPIKVERDGASPWFSLYGLLWPKKDIFIEKRVDLDYISVGDKVCIRKAQISEALQEFRESKSYKLKIRLSKIPQDDLSEKEQDDSAENAQDLAGAPEVTGAPEYSGAPEDQEQSSGVDNESGSFFFDPVAVQYFKIFVTYFQIMGAFWTFDVDWPDLLVSIMEYSSYIFQFDLFRAPNLSCFWAEASFSTKLIAYTLVPMLLVVLIYGVPGLIYYIQSKKCIYVSPSGNESDWKRREKAKDLSMQWAMILIFFVYPVVSLTILQAFDCRPGTDTAGRNGLNRLSANLKENCPHQGSFVQAWASIFILVYPIGLPLFVFLAMHEMRVPEIAKHAKCCSIVVSMIHAFIQDCTTPESSRLSALWSPLAMPVKQLMEQEEHSQSVSVKSSEQVQEQTAQVPSNKLTVLVADMVQKSDDFGGSGLNEHEIRNILEMENPNVRRKGSPMSTDAVEGGNSICIKITSFKNKINEVYKASRALYKKCTGEGTSSFYADANGDSSADLDSQMQRTCRTSNLFTGAENGFLPYLTDLQLEALFWWSQVKIHNSRGSTEPEDSDEEKELFEEFEKDSILKLRSIEDNKGHLSSRNLYLAVVNNGIQLKMTYDPPVWNKCRPSKDKMGHLTPSERSQKDLYSMSTDEIDEMRFAALDSVGIVFASYKMEYWYWELIEMFRK